MPITPSYKTELSFGARLGKRIIGIDEVGRGALAGPVVVAAVQIPMHALPHLTGLTIRDSKTLSCKQREKVARQLRQIDSLRLRIAHASHKLIDRLNITGATDLAIRRLLSHVQADTVLIDGKRVPAGVCAQAIVKGDAHVLSIAAASILAKVWRDTWMRRLARAFPHYGWEKNAGYPTAQHRDAIRKFGVSPWHRQQFVSHLIDRHSQ